MDGNSDTPRLSRPESGRDRERSRRERDIERERRRAGDSSWSRDRDQDRNKRGGKDRDRRDRDRDYYGRGDKRGRSRSRSPYRDDRRHRHRRRDNSPDSEDVPPIDEWKNDETRKFESMWDVVRPGFERVPIEIAKRSGLFNLPGDTTLPNRELLRPYVNPSNLETDFITASINPNGRPGNMTIRSNTRLQLNQNSTNDGTQFLNRLSHEFNPNNSGGLPDSLPFAPATGSNSTTSLSAHSINGFDKTLSPQNSRSSRRIVITGYKEQRFSVTPEEVAEFFTETLGSIKLLHPLDGSPRFEGGPPTEILPIVCSTQSSKDGSSVILEFATSEIATIAITFNGAYFKELDDQWKMEIRRPEDYITPRPTSTDIDQNKTESDKDIEEEEKKFNIKHEDNDQDEKYDERLKSILARILDSENKIYVADIPFNVNKVQIFELLSTFGQLSGLQVIYDINGPADETRGIAFAEFADPSVTDTAIQEIKQLQLGDSFLRAGRASLGLNAPLASIPMDINVTGSLIGSILTYKTQNEGSTQNGLTDTRVLMLLNLVTIDELTDDQEYREIVQDITAECGKFGAIEDLLVPRPDAAILAASSQRIVAGSGPSSTTSGPASTTLGNKPGVKNADTMGVGKVFIKFATRDACREAFKSLGGRKFSDRTVISAFFSEDNFNLGIF